MSTLTKPNMNFYYFKMNIKYIEIQYLHGHFNTFKIRYEIYQRSIRSDYACDTIMYLMSNTMKIIKHFEIFGLAGT